MHEQDEACMCFPASVPISLECSLALGQGLLRSSGSSFCLLHAPEPLPRGVQTVRSHRRRSDGKRETLSL